MWKILLVLSLAFATAAHANPSGTIRVIDGDTFDIGGERVRLFGVDAPELGQPCTQGRQTFDCGRWVTDQVRARFEGQRARCTTRDVDRYGRQVATCDVGGVDLGQVIVTEGWATAYRRYSMLYDLDEKAAVVAARGLWATTMEAPEDFRATSNAAPAAPDPACNIKGNISNSGRIYHRPGNRDYDRTVINEAQGERWFCSEAEARAAGWRAARN